MATDKSEVPVQAYSMPGAEPEPQYVVAPTNIRAEPPQKSFAISPFEIGDISWCLYSFILPHCAMGSARTKLDGSNCMVTCFHINPVVLRWITRSAYNIPGSACDDCLMGTFCPCCVINQAAQTAAQNGRPYPDVGPEYHRVMTNPQKNTDCCENCCYATFCLPCAIGTSLQTSMGMPFWMGCFCTNFCLSRNLVRYHYRLTGSDCGEDCALPYGACCLAWVLSAWVPCAMCCTCPLFIGLVMTTLNEAKTRGNINPDAPNGTYLRPPVNNLYPVVLNSGPVVMQPGAPQYVYYTQQQVPVPQPGANVTYAQAPAVIYANPAAVMATASYEMPPTAPAPKV